MKREDYPYLYETHMHTCESSACAHHTGKEMAQAAEDAGYTGIIITDHSWYGNHCIDDTLPWEEWIEQFCRGYENARNWGEKALLHRGLLSGFFRRGGLSSDQRRCMV